MSGILDKKSRVLDVLITDEGRRQLAAGDMRIKYVAFTDAGVRYAKDVASGSADATERIYFEAASLPQDQVTFEANDSGRLNSFPNSTGFQLADGRILEHSFSALTSSTYTGSLENVTFLSSDIFAATASVILNESVENFRKQRFIATFDSIFEDDGFAVGPDAIEYTLVPNRPIIDKEDYAGNVNELESLFSDPRVSNVKNFKYLPPLNKVDDDSVNTKNLAETSKYRLGAYQPLGMVKPLTYVQLEHELKYFEDIGFCKTVSLDPTSHDNNVVVQFFEKGYNTLSKLDVIDFGIHKSDESVSHVFFVGKLMIDDFNTHTFIHLFTMVFQ